ncbi:MAG: hypothetical protein JRH01_17130 [Deltaproteobacteria bacterium]|nr:hypothetical protein [Deltaproteobacteria bacterium]MBW2392835.1 hypothetical protein [Deltaproteobacteria bacterium]
MPHPHNPFVTNFVRPDPLFRFHWIAFLQGFRREDTSMPPNIRDAGAGAEAIEALGTLGGRYETLFLIRSSTDEEYEKNLKLMDKNLSSNSPELVEDVLEFHPIDVSRLERGNTAVILTRLMWNDLDAIYRLHLHPGFTTLEQELLRETRPYISKGYRGKMILSQEIADQFAPEYANRGDIEYTQRRGAWYQSLGRADQKGRRCLVDRSELLSAAYILHLPEVECLNGANLLLAFGMGATQTLAIWHRLRTDLMPLLNHWGFTMVEMRATPEPEHGSNLDWFEDWDMKTILQTDLL